MPGTAATKSTRAPGSRESTSYGPTASSAVNLSNSGIAICTCASFSLEPVAVAGGADPEPAVERAAHRLDGAEAAVVRDRLELLAGRLEPQPRVVDAQGLDIGCRRHPDLAAEGAREVALAHRGAGCEGGHGEVRGEVRRHPLLELPDRPPLGELRLEVRAELRLAARALDEDDEPARGLERGGAAEVLLDEGESEVHPGGHAGARPHVAVADVDRVRVDLYGRVTAREVLRRGPMRRGTAAVEQAGLGEHVGAAADGRDAPCAPRRSPHPAYEALVLDRLEHAAPARDDERVDRSAEAVCGTVRNDREAAVRGERPLLRRDDLDGVLAVATQLVRRREDLVGTGYVEVLDVVEGEDGDAPHGSIITRGGGGGNDKLRTVSANYAIGQLVHDPREDRRGRGHGGGLGARGG